MRSGSFRNKHAEEVPRENGSVYKDFNRSDILYSGLEGENKIWLNKCYQISYQNTYSIIIICTIDHPKPIPGAGGSSVAA